MNHLIAKIRVQGSPIKFRKVLSGRDIYSLPSDLNNHIEYSANHNLDEDSWFGIESFSKKKYCIPLLKENFNSIDYDSLTSISFDKIDYICSYQNQSEFYFQKISKTQLISKKAISYIGDAFNFEENSRNIIINNKPDAIYLKDKDILYFKNLSAITSIFKGIDELYREATEEETKKFLNEGFISLRHSFSAEKVKKANRKRIALAINTLKSFNNIEKSKVIDYIKDYCPELESNNNSFIIGSEEELKSLLFGIDQRYYTTLVKDEKRLANSVITLMPS